MSTLPTSTSPMSISDTANSRAMVYRRKAATCGRLALYAIEPPDRDRLARMRDAWLSLAATEDWLDGNPGQRTDTAS
jgi:hypothetical protein